MNRNNHSNQSSMRKQQIAMERQQMQQRNPMNMRAIFEDDGKEREDDDRPSQAERPPVLAKIDESHDEETIMDRQPTINVMMIGHVNNGKTTLSEALSGENTSRISTEVKENRTIYLGYTSFKIFRCGACPIPQAYGTRPSKCMTSVCEYCGNEMLLMRHVSVVDCPGHSELMGTMLSGASVVDGALLVMSATNARPAPQTEEHMTAARLLGVADDLIVVQNKVDLVPARQACAHASEIKKFLRKNCYSAQRTNTIPIVPMCAQKRLNVDALCMAIVNHIPIPTRQVNSDLLMHVIRSFDVNRRGCRWQDLRGGVAGCVISQGVLRVGQEVEIRPGFARKEDGRWVAYPLLSTVVSARCGSRRLDEVFPGANVGVGLTVDPFLTKRDKMVGCVIGSVGSTAFPPVFAVAKIFVTTLGKFGSFSRTDKETVRVNIGSFQCTAAVTCETLEGGRDGVIAELSRPCCAQIGSRVAILRRRGKEEEWALDGGGVIFKVKALPLRYR